MQIINKIIYYLYHLEECYEQIYIRLYLGVRNPACLSVFSMKSKGVRRAYAAIRKLLDGKMDKALYSEIVQCIDMIRENKPYEAVREKYDSVLYQLEQIPTGLFTGHRWCTIATVLCCNGLFRAEAVCRRKSQQYFMSSRGNYAQKITISLENRDLKTARMLIDYVCRRSLWKCFMKEQIQYYKIYYNLLKKGDDVPYPIDWGAIGNTDKNFQVYLAQKEVKIIGPAIKEDDISQENSYIIRMNSGEVEVEQHKAEAIYFRPEPYKKVFGKKPPVIKHLGKICVYDYEASPPKVNKERITYAPTCIFFMKSMSGVPNILLDVLVNKAASIYIGGTTLYMSKKTYFDQYACYSEPKKNKDIYLIGLANHNLQSQFIFLQNLYQAGCFKADEALDAILSLSVEEYLTNMEHLHVF